MSQSFQDRLNEIANLQGRMPIDGSRIEGEPGPPPPELPIRGPVDLSQVPDAPEYIDDEEELESPLIPKPVEKPRFSQDFVAALPELPKPDLAVAAFGDRCVGSWHGDEVELSPSEHTAVGAIVIRALIRRDEAELAAKRGLLPKRRRSRRSAGPSPGGVSAVVGTDSPSPQPAPSPKKRGRPKRVRLWSEK